MRRRTHGKRCAESHTHWKVCRCVCRGRNHGETHRDPGLLQYVDDDARRAEAPPAAKTKPKPKRKKRKRK